MVGGWISSVPGSLILGAQGASWWRFSWSLGPARTVRRLAGRAGVGDETRRFYQSRYHLGRGRRAREAGQFEKGVREARRALALNRCDAWALSLLGQCLQRQRASDLEGARQALERACVLDPTNGYFVGLLLGVLNAQGDAAACLDLLTWAWWNGAPVERWLPDGPPIPERERESPECGVVSTEERAALPAIRALRRVPEAPALPAGRQPARAYGA